MSPATLQNAPDLRKGYPRSPNAVVGDFVLLGRIIDKCRAMIAGTNGEYNFNCPLDQRFFEFTGIDAKAFKQQVADGKSDEELGAWIKQNSKPLSQEQIFAWCYEQRWRVPADPDARFYFEKLRREAVPERYDVQTWFQLLDAEEGRF